MFLSNQEVKDEIRVLLPSQLQVALLPVRALIRIFV